MSKGYIPGGVGEALSILSGRLSTAISRSDYNGKVSFRVVGSVPLDLTENYTSGFTQGRRSKSWATEQEVIDELVAHGVETFQLADCSWYGR